MKTRIFIVIAVVAFAFITLATAKQSCPIAKSGCQISCQQDSACELGKGCDKGKDANKGCNKEKSKEKNKEKDKDCDKDKDKNQDRDRDRDKDCDKDPNS